MCKKKLIQVCFSFCALLTLMASVASAAEKYVVDDLPVHLTRGPGSEYRIIGNANAGEKVTELVKSDDGKFTQIKTENGRVAWIETKFLTRTVSLKERFPKLEQEIEQLKEKIANTEQSKEASISEYTSKITVAYQEIETLEKTNKILQAETNEQKAQIESLSHLVDQNRQSLMLTWFMYGGLVAGASLILGLILPYIIPNRRKKDRWMN